MLAAEEVELKARACDCRFGGLLRMALLSTARRYASVEDVSGRADRACKVLACSPHIKDLVGSCETEGLFRR